MFCSASWWKLIKRQYQTLAYQSVHYKVLKRNKLIRFSNKSKPRWSTVDEYIFGQLAVNSGDGKELCSVERRAMSKMKLKSKPKSTTAAGFRKNKSEHESGDLNPPQHNFRLFIRNFCTYGQFHAEN